MHTPLVPLRGPNHLGLPESFARGFLASGVLWRGPWSYATQTRPQVSAPKHCCSTLVFLSKMESFSRRGNHSSIQSHSADLDLAKKMIISPRYLTFLQIIFRPLASSYFPPCLSATSLWPLDVMLFSSLILFRRMSTIVGNTRKAKVASHIQILKLTVKILLFVNKVPT